MQLLRTWIFHQHFHHLADHHRTKWLVSNDLWKRKNHCLLGTGSTMWYIRIRIKFLPPSDPSTLRHPMVCIHPVNPKLPKIPSLTWKKTKDEWKSEVAITLPALLETIYSQKNKRLHHASSNQRTLSPMVTLHPLWMRNSTTLQPNQAFLSAEQHPSILYTKGKPMENPTKIHKIILHLRMTSQAGWHHRSLPILCTVVDPRKKASVSESSPGFGSAPSSSS